MLKVKKLIEKYNKLHGYNTKDASITFSLANAPLGKKIFGKYADKSITLLDSDVVKNIGDLTIAPGYAKLRDKIFGGKLGSCLVQTVHYIRLVKQNQNKYISF